jgi:hypothetical protein
MGLDFPSRDLNLKLWSKEWLLEPNKICQNDFN